MEYEERQCAGSGNNAKFSLFFFDRVMAAELAPKLLHKDATNVKNAEVCLRTSIVMFHFWRVHGGQTPKMTTSVAP